MSRLCLLAKSPIGFFSATILTGILIANLCGFNVSALFLQFVGVITALVSIESTKKQLGAEGIMRSLAKQLDEMKRLMFQYNKRPRQTEDVMEQVIAGENILGFNQAVLNNVDSPSLLSLRKDIEQLSENQQVILNLIKEESKERRLSLKALMKAAENYRDDTRKTFINIHIKGSEFTVIGVALSFVGAIFSSWS